jgi:hypothetical protein
MAIGGLTHEQLPNPKIRTCYNDIIRKSKSIGYKLDTIKYLHGNLADNISQISEEDAIILVGEIADCLERIYSCMEYVSFVLKEVLKEKGTLTSSYHDLIKKVLKNKNPASVYADKIVVNFIEGTTDWYAIVHDIRSEETHYSMGEIEVEDNKIVYKIQKQTNKETVYDLIRKRDHADEIPGREYRLKVEDLTKIYLGFIDSIKELEEILLMA